MPNEIKRLAKKYLNDPVYVELNVELVAPANLEHWFAPMDPKRHEAQLLEYLTEQKPTQAIIFCNSRRNVEALHKQLKKQLDSVEMIHGGMEVLVVFH